MQTREDALDRLAKSKFRSLFHLTEAEKAYRATYKTVPGNFPGKTCWADF
jgi:hypothetical protein